MRISNFDEYSRVNTDAAQPGIIYDTIAPDGDYGKWKNADLGTLYIRALASNVKLYQKRAHVPEDADWVELGITTAGNGAGFIPVPLATVFKVTSNSILERLDTGRRTRNINIPLNALVEVGSNNFLNVAANGGVFATDTTPVKQFTNGDTDSAARLNWVATNVDPFFFQFNVPEDYDEGSAITVNFLAAMGGASDTPVLSLDTYFDVGDTKVEDDTGAVTGTTVATYTASIAAGDIPASAKTVSIEVTPGAHGSDTLLLYAVWVTYTVAAAPTLTTTNGDTDGAWVITWAAGDVTPIAFQVPIPPDIDDTEDVTVHFRVKSGGGNDTPALTIDSYFNEADTKVEDSTAAITDAFTEKIATIGSADVPSGAQTITVEMTPEAHSTDTLVISAIWIEFART